MELCEPLEETKGEGEVMTSNDALLQIVAILDEHQIVLDLILNIIEARVGVNYRPERLRLANAQNILSELTGPPTADSMPPAVEARFGVGGRETNEAEYKR